MISERDLLLFIDSNRHKDVNALYLAMRKEFPALSPRVIVTCIERALCAYAEYDTENKRDD